MIQYDASATLCSDEASSERPLGNLSSKSPVDKYDTHKLYAKSPQTANGHISVYNLHSHLRIISSKWRICGLADPRPVHSPSFLGIPRKGF